MWHIKKRSLGQVLTLYMFITPFLLSFLQDVLHVPGVIKYTIDLAWISVLLFMVFARKQFVYKKTLPILVLFIVYVLYVSIVYLFEYQSIYYFLWGIRNNVRYYIAFFAFVYFFDKDDIEFCFKFIDVLFVAHVLATFVQFLILGYKGDFLGGIFGTQLGCNGNAMILLTVVCIKSLLMYMNEKERLIPCLLKCSVSLVTAAMAELKFFFILFLIILIMAALITKFSLKKIVFIVGVSFVVFFAGNIFTAIWGEEHSLSFDRIVELLTATSYASERDLGRFTAIPVISEAILADVPHKLFGLGLGNCDTSAFAICNTPFYQSHSYLNYNWLSSAFSFIETGYIGLGLFLTFFVLVLICAVSLKLKKSSYELHSEMSIIMCVVCVILIFYNSSLRTDIGYSAYFVLALPFVSTSKSVSETLVEDKRRI